MEVIDIKRKRIYEIIENPTLSKEEKMDKIAVIISKTDEEIIKDEKNAKTDSSLKTDLESVFHELFPKKGRTK